MSDLRLPSSAEVRRVKGQCAETVLSFQGAKIPCTRAAGYGPGGLLCQYHAKQLENPEPPKTEKAKPLAVPDEKGKTMLVRRWILSQKKTDEANEVLLPDGAIPIQLMYDRDGSNIIVLMVPKDLEPLELSERRT